MSENSDGKALVVLEQEDIDLLLMALEEMADVAEWDVQPAHRKLMAIDRDSDNSYRVA